MSVQGNKLLGSLFPSYLEARVYPDVHLSNLLCPFAPVGKELNQDLK